MGLIELFEEEYLDVSSGRASVRELLELLAGSIVFALAASALAYYLLGATVATYVAGGLVVIFTITIVSQAYWAVTGREDYRG